MAERIAKFFRRNGVYFASAGLTWIALALAAYGLALRNYGNQSQEVLNSSSGQVGARILPESELEVRQGRISSATASPLSGQPMEFRIEGSDEPLFIPPETVRSEAERRSVEAFLKPGTRVRAKISRKGHLVLELQGNPDTPFVRHLLRMTDGLDRLAQAPEGATARSKIFLGLALVILGMIPVVLVVQRSEKL